MLAHVGPEWRVQPVMWSSLTLSVDKGITKHSAPDQTRPDQRPAFKIRSPSFVLVPVVRADNPVLTHLHVFVRNVKLYCLELRLYLDFGVRLSCEFLCFPFETRARRLAGVRTDLLRRTRLPQRRVSWTVEGHGRCDRLSTGMSTRGGCIWRTSRGATVVCTKSTQFLTSRLSTARTRGRITPATEGNGSSRLSIGSPQTFWKRTPARIFNAGFALGPRMNLRLPTCLF